MNCDHPREWRVFYRRTDPHQDVCGRCGGIMVIPLQPTSEEPHLVEGDQPPPE